MPILNSHQIYYLYSSNVDELIKVEPSKTTARFRGRTLLFRNFSELPVYYLEFNSAESLKKFKLCSFINSSILTKIQNKEIFLVLNNSYESFHDVVESIYNNIVIDQKIPESQIILCSESSDIISEVNRCSKKYGRDEIKIEWLRQGEFEIVRSYKSTLGKLNEYKLRTLAIKHYDRKFLCLNRRWRPHRASLVALLQSLNLLDKGYISLGDTGDGNNWSTILDEIITLSKNNQFIHNCFIANTDKILNTPPLYVDTDDLKTNRAGLEFKTIEYYKNTYFSVVTETNFYANVGYLSSTAGRFLSEKVFKPIACRHPFIVVSVPNFLDRVKELGYKTFTPFINESYDRILDDNERLHAIVQEIDRLCNLNNQQLNDFLIGVRDIVDYNHNILINKKIFHNKLYE